MRNVSGRHQSLHLKNIRCHNPRDDRHLILIEGRVRHFALRNCEVLLTNPRGSVKLMETRGDLARVDVLSVANVTATGLAAIVADDQHAVKSLSLDHVVMIRP